MVFEGVHSRVDRWRRKLRTLPFARSESGAVAVEFAIVAIPFIVLVFGVLEMAVVLLIYSTLENATGDAARTIRTGALQGQGTATAQTFVTTICNGLGWLQSDCQNQLKVDVRTMGQFASPSEPDPYASGTFDPTKVTFNLGTPGSIVLVRAWYPWQIVMPIANQALSHDVSGVAMVQATTTFKNEPYAP